MIPIIDLHCHPCMKIYLFNRNISKKHFPSADIIPTGMHVDLPGMETSNVKVAFCSHYIPEAALGKLKKSELTFKILRFIFRRLFNKWEIGSVQNDAYNKTLKSFELLENQVTKAADKFNVELVKNIHSFNNAFDQGKTIIIHTIEGSHSLGSGGTNAAYYITHLKVLKSKGLCLLTLSHFFPNDLCDSAGGVFPSVVKRIGYDNSVVIKNGLTPIGEKVVEWCLDNGVLLCLVHSSIKTRNKIYEMLQIRRDAGLANVPVMFTHNGLRDLAAPNMQNQYDKEYLPDIAELKKIKEFGGLLGLILMNYWLIGIEEDNPTTIDNAIPHLLNTITYIHKHLGDYDNIAIGTDLDGFTQVPDDFKHIKRLQLLPQAIDAHFGREVAEKIAYKNALRVIRQTWHA